MITAIVAYRKLKKRLGDDFKIEQGFEIKDAFIFSVVNKLGQDGYPFFSVLKSTGEIGGYNPMRNIQEYMNAVKLHQLNIQELDKPLAKF